jgi:aminobenzoyl-glutamate utilization protein B
MPGAKLIDANMRRLGEVKFTPEEHEFAKQIQREAGGKPIGMIEKINPLVEKPGDPQGGSTDVADVSWVVPTLHFSAVTAPSEAPWHAWPVVAAGGMSIGHKGMIFASKTLATTMVDLFLDANQRELIRKDFETRKGDQVYKGFIPDGPPPVPKED